MSEHCSSEVGHELRQRRDDVLEGPWWLLQIGGLAVDDLSQRIGVEVEEIAEELIGMLCLDAIGQATLLQLFLIPTELLGQVRQVAERILPLAIPSLLEREHVFDSESAVLASLRVRDATFIEETDQVLP